MNRDDLGSIRFGRCRFTIGDTQNDRGCISVGMCLMMLGIIENVEDDVASCFHLDWSI